MNILLIAFLVVLLVPFVSATWRTSLAGLSLQGLLMGWMVLPEMFSAGPSAEGIVVLFDVVAVRGIFVPWLLYRVLRAWNASPRNEVIPPNLLSWVVAGGLVAIAFRFASRLESPGEGQTRVAVAAAGVLLGLYVLSTQTGTFSQVAGALRIENAIALFELGHAHPAPLPVQIGLTAVFALTAGLFALYVGWLQAPAPPEPPPSRPAL